MPTEPTKAKPAKVAEPKSKQPAAKETPAEPTEPIELYCNQCGESTPALYLHEKLTMLVCADCAAGNDPEAEPVDAAEPTDDDDVEKAFSDDSWSTPEADLSPEDFCKVCVIDTNDSTPKVKSKCHLPIRSKPGAPINKAALRNASARLGQVNGISSAQRAAAHTRLQSMMKSAGMEVSKSAEPAPRLEVTVEAPVLAQQEFLKSAHSSAKRIAYGVAYPVYGPGEADSQSDTMSPEEIEKAAHKFMVESRAYDMHHTIFDLGPNDAAVVESYIAPVDLTLQDMYGEDKLIRKGSWVVATKFGEAVWDSVLKGELNAYSIRGVGKRAPVTT